MLHEHCLKLNSFSILDFTHFFLYYWYFIFLNLRDYCNDGYKGVFCENRCPYPTFGSQCNERCQCSTEFCHHRSGCRAPGNKNGEIEIKQDHHTS